MKIRSITILSTVLLFSTSNSLSAQLFKKNKSWNKIDGKSFIKMLIIKFAYLLDSNNYKYYIYFNY